MSDSCYMSRMKEKCLCSGRNIKNENTNPERSDIEVAQDMNLQHALSWIHSATFLNWAEPQLLTISCCHTEDVILV